MVHILQWRGNCHFYLSYDENTNFSSFDDGKYKTYFKNFESVYPEPAYCILGIIDDNKIF